MKVGIIGMGAQGQRLSACLVKLGQDVQGFDVLDQWPDPSNLGRYQLDAVVIASPAEWHEHHLRVVIEKGIRAIFVEKPISDRMTSTLWSLVRQTADWPCQVGYNLRFDPRVQSLRERVSTHIRKFAWLHTASDLAHWHGQRYGSAVFECSHEIDAALWIMGPGRCVSAINSGAELWDLTIAHDFGWYSHVHMNYCTAPYVRHHAVLLDTGEIVSRHLAEPCASMYDDEMAHWLRCVQAGIETDVPLSVGLDTLAIIEEARCHVSSA